MQEQLERGQIIPAFSLPGPDGTHYSSWTYKQREHLLLLFLSNSTSEASQQLLSIYSQHYAALREEKCMLLVITADTVATHLQVQETRHLPFPLLADPQCQTIARYTHWDKQNKYIQPAIVLADLYNAFYEQWSADHEAELPPITEPLESLQYINRLCTP